MDSPDEASAAEEYPNRIRASSEGSRGSAVKPVVRHHPIIVKRIPVEGI